MKNRKLTITLACVVMLSTVLSGCSSTNTTTVTESTDKDSAELIKDIATTQTFTDEEVGQEDIESIVMAGVNSPSSMNGQPWHFSVVTNQETLDQIASDMGGGFGGGSMPSSIPSATDGSTFNPGNMPEGMTPPSGANGSPFDPNSIPQGAPATNGNENGNDSSSVVQTSMATTSATAKAGIADAPCAIIVSCKTGSELDAGIAVQNMSVEAQLLGYGTKIISSTTMALNGTSAASYKETLGIPDDMKVVCVLLVGHTDTTDTDSSSSATTRSSIEDLVTYVK